MHRIMLFVALASAGCIGPTKTRGRVVSGVTAGLGTLMIVDGLTSDCDTPDLGKAISCGISKDIGPKMGGALLLLAAATLAVNELREMEPVPTDRPAPIAQAPAAPDPVPPPATDVPMLR